MRLLNTKNLTLKEFYGDQIPEYAILSHTWGENELLFSDIGQAQSSKKQGYVKVSQFCSHAAKHGFEWAWVDTCCIDKSSSAELSESINSMYQWYKSAHTCYVYMSDVSTGGGPPAREEVKGLSDARWWTRGWTLQELIAPVQVEFYDATWNYIGTKRSLEKEITEITGIDIEILRGQDPSLRNVAERMSWAAERVTSRLEDMAYCLLGLFNVSMPMLYGEGTRAFVRLQEEIMKTIEDYTLFVWSNPIQDAPSFMTRSILANSPSAFALRNPQSRHYSLLEKLSPLEAEDELSDILDLLEPDDAGPGLPPTLTARGLQMTLPLLRDKVSGGFIAFMYCFAHDGQMLCIRIRKSVESSHLYGKLPNNELVLFDRSKIEQSSFKRKTIYFHISSPVQVSWKPKWNIAPLDWDNDAKFEASIYMGYGTSRSPVKYSTRSWFKRRPGICVIYEFALGNACFWVLFGIYGNHTPYCDIRTKPVKHSTANKNLASLLDTLTMDIPETSSPPLYTSKCLKSVGNVVLETEVRWRPRQWEEMKKSEPGRDLIFLKPRESRVPLNEQSLYSLEIKVNNERDKDPRLVKDWTAQSLGEAMIASVNSQK